MTCYCLVDIPCLSVELYSILVSNVVYVLYTGRYMPPCPVQHTRMSQAIAALQSGLCAAAYSAVRNLPTSTLSRSAEYGANTAAHMQNANTHQPPASVYFS